MRERQHIRQRLLEKRKALTPVERQSAAASITQTICQLPVFQQSQHIAVYHAVNGEVETRALIEHIWSAGKICYLPVLHGHEHNTLWFAPYKAGDTLKPNRYGIPEPKHSHATQCAPDELDVVCIPLVAFDQQGNRLGMGAGYYDRAFAFLNAADAARRSHLLGLAYAFQEQVLPAPEAWDVPLHMVVTEVGQYVYGL